MCVEYDKNLNLKLSHPAGLSLIDCFADTFRKAINQNYPLHAGG
jgi:hypothetical protein